MSAPIYSLNGKYQLGWDGTRYTCTCGDFVHRQAHEPGGRCKHLRERSDEELERLLLPDETPTDEAQPLQTQLEKWLTDQKAVVGKALEDEQGNLLFALLPPQGKDECDTQQLQLRLFERAKRLGRVRRLGISRMELTIHGRRVVLAYARRAA